MSEERIFAPLPTPVLPASLTVLKYTATTVPVGMIAGSYFNTVIVPIFLEICQSQNSALKIGLNLLGIPGITFAFSSLILQAIGKMKLPHDNRTFPGDFDEEIPLINYEPEISSIRKNKFKIFSLLFLGLASGLAVALVMWIQTEEYDIHYKFMALGILVPLLGFCIEAIETWFGGEMQHVHDTLSYLYTGETLHGDALQLDVSRALSVIIVPTMVISWYSIVDELRRNLLAGVDASTGELVVRGVIFSVSTLGTILSSILLDFEKFGEMILEFYQFKDQHPKNIAAFMFGSVAALQYFVIGAEMHELIETHPPAAYALATLCALPKVGTHFRLIQEFFAMCKEELLPAVKILAAETKKLTPCGPSRTDMLALS